MRGRLAAGVITATLLAGAILAAPVLGAPGSNGPPTPYRALYTGASNTGTVATDTGSVTLGLRFTPSVNGYLDSVEFFRGSSANTARHVSLWSATGTRLATASTRDTRLGWNWGRFDRPVRVTAGTTYVASYHAPAGRYNVDANGSKSPRTIAPLTFPAGGGVYRYGSAEAFPDKRWQSSEYFVSPVFIADVAGAGSSPPPPPPTSTAMPTPTATTPSPTPTSTPAPTPSGEACYLPGDGACGPYSYSKIPNSNGYNTYANNQLWGCGAPGSCGPQTMTAWGAGRWEVTSTQRAGNTGVLTYPNTQQLMNNWSGRGWNGPGPHTDTPISGLAKLESSYSERMNENDGTIAQAAYDIWTSAGEIMIWVDTTSLRGSGGAVRVDSGTIDGQPFTYYVYGGSLPIIKFDTNRRSATVDILEALNWLVSKGHIPANTTIGQLNFGFEICSTGGVAEKFEVLDYSITAVPK